VGLRRIEKELLCPVCGDVVASAVYRPWLGSFAFTAPAGHRVFPRRAALLLREVEQQLDRLAPDAPGVERRRLQGRAEFVHAHLEELIYDLRCPRGHATLRTAPQILRALRRVPGRWVTP
jgi:hypothetical protein